MKIINLFAGPGTGKSTHAAGLFYHLKKNNYNTELIREYAKDKTWLKDHKTLQNQIYVTAKQIHRQYMIMDQVEIAVTDSPILLGLVYKGFGCTPSYEKWLMEVFNLFNNTNILLVRDPVYHSYNPKGRNETEEQAKIKDKEIEDFLVRLAIPYFKVRVNEETSSILYKIATGIGDCKNEQK